MTVQLREHPDILDLSWGHPRPGLLPVEDWSRAQEQTLRTYGWEALTYGRDRGPAPLIDWLDERLGDRHTFVTAGASHALDLVCAALTAPGDVALVDSPTYHLAFRILTDRGLDLVEVPADDPDAVAAAVGRIRADGRTVRLFYLVPTFANPTGRSLPDDRRHALVDLAARHHLTLVEDDTYRELAYDRPAPASLRHLAGDDHTVVRIGSFAKTVAPGLRLGWINADAPTVGRLERLGYVHSGGGVNHATALTMAVFGTSGAFERHVAVLRDRYREQRDALAAPLGAAPPAGGWFLWLPLPPGLDADDLLAAAERHGVSFVPGTRFHAAGGGGSGHVRLSFSRLPPEQLSEAGRRLATYC